MTLRDTIGFIWEHPLTRRRRLAALLRFAGWQVRSRLSQDVEIRWVDSARVIARRGMTGFTGNIYCGLHEFADMSLVLHLLRPDDLFLDIGANVGSYTLLASAVCGARTLAFEPDPVTATFLRRNIDANGLGERALAHEMALGDRAGQVDFTVGRDTMNQVSEGGAGPTRSVRLGRLDDIPAARGATLIKMDVEGFEEQVLGGAEEVLEDRSLLAILSEGQDERVTGILGRHGFERAYYEPNTRTLQSSPLGGFEGNGLFVRDRAAVMERVAGAPKRHVIGQSI